jgi:hypothetical protein
VRIVADEHLSPRILRAVQDIALPRNDSIILESVRHSDLIGSEDEYWIERVAASGGNGILSGDRRMLKRPRILTIIRDSGLIAVMLPAVWSNANRTFQAAFVLYWWPAIQKTFQDGETGSIWTVPDGFGHGPLIRDPVPETSSKTK